jgi:SAM-dependent methyltransferase
MGLDINTSALLHDWIGRYGVTGPLLTLGVQELNFTSAQFCAVIGCAPPPGDPRRVLAANELMRLCGVGETYSLDISAHEGADFLVDLNDNNPPPHLLSRFGAILNGGTIEHVFNIPHALTAITRMLRPGGVIIHVVPVHNWIDHGFYQIGPTLLFDYYAAARFDILESAALAFSPGNSACEVAPLPPGAVPAAGERTVLAMFAARKTAGSLDAVTPTQSIYAREPVHPPPDLRWFVPYSTQAGIGRGVECARYALGPFAQGDGVAWVAALPPGAASGDNAALPRRSALVLFENERLLGPAHAAHAAIGSAGGGSYSHWQDYLLFSTSDNSDPNRNGRRYSAVIPAPSDCGARCRRV